MTRSEYRDYFENEIAAKLPEIAHTPQNPRFGVMDIETVVMGEMKAELDIRQYVMILDHYEGLRNIKDRDNPKKTLLCAFQIIRHVELSNEAEKDEVLEECERIAEKIIAKIVFHANKRLFFKNLDFNTDIPMMKVGPIFDNCFGIRVELSLYQAQSLIYNPIEWLP